MKLHADATRCETCAVHGVEDAAFMPLSTAANAPRGAWAVGRVA